VNKNYTTKEVRTGDLLPGDRIWDADRVWEVLRVIPNDDGTVTLYAYPLQDGTLHRAKVVCPPWAKQNKMVLR
jgi:hypothetical protein